MTGRRLLIWGLAGIASAFACGAGVFIYDDLHGRRARRAASTPAPAGTELEAPAAPYVTMPAPPRELSFEMPAAAIEEFMPRPHAQAATAEDEREHVLTELEASGAGGREWLEPLRQMSEGWLGEARNRGVGTTLSPWSCFQGGCTVTQVHEQPEQLEAFSELVSRSNAFTAWTGGKFRTGAVALPNGRVEATWVFYAPDRPSDREL